MHFRCLRITAESCHRLGQFPTPIDIVGFGLLELSGAIELLYVSPDARFCVVSKALLAALEDEALAAVVWEMKLESSNTALRFYRSAGYTPEGEPRHQYCRTYCHPMTLKIERSA